MPDGLKTLETRRGTYRLQNVDVWSARFRQPDGRGILAPRARVLALGSCFATGAARYLRRRGYTARRYPGGLLYNSHVVRLELEHVLGGEEWPAEIALAADSGWAHRFRRISAQTPEELGKLDRRASRRAREAISRADLILILLGTTTEVWRDAPSGQPTNQIPPPETYHAGDWRLDAGRLDALRDDVAAIGRTLREHTEARQVYSVCPIPLHATWLDRHIIEANGRSKALLRTALEIELDEADTYLPLWDWTLAQTERRSPTKRDGRHFDRRGFNRIMLFAESYLATENIPPLGARERIHATAEDLRERITGRR
ncbi:MAG: GSCFA domain-containing protein [Actinomycetota bacterium]|nr:GSCFA domain-containing protein [Actinomycetota bacterium]